MFCRVEEVVRDGMAARFDYTNLLFRCKEFPVAFAPRGSCCSLVCLGLGLNSICVVWAVRDMELCPPETRGVIRNLFMVYEGCPYDFGSGLPSGLLCLHEKLGVFYCVVLALERTRPYTWGGHMTKVGLGGKAYNVC